jgi:hypothetical protein
MSSTVIEQAVEREEPAAPKKNYLNADHTIKSWLLTGDHKRIAVLYLISVTFFFFLGGLAAAFIRAELTSPMGTLLNSEQDVQRPRDHHDLLLPGRGHSGGARQLPDPLDDRGA